MKAHAISHAAPHVAWHPCPPSGGCSHCSVFACPNRLASKVSPAQRVRALFAASAH